MKKENENEWFTKTSSIGFDQNKTHEEGKFSEFEKRKGEYKYNKKSKVHFRMC